LKEVPDLTCFFSQSETCTMLTSCSPDQLQSENLSIAIYKNTIRSTY